MTEHADSKPLRTRLARIEGQVRGISKMLEEDRYCLDIVAQVRAVRAALRKVESAVLERHVESCVEAAITSGDSETQRRVISELTTLINNADH